MRINLHVIFVLTLLVFLLKFVISSAFAYHALKELKMQKDWALVNDVAHIQLALSDTDQLSSPLSSEFEQNLKFLQDKSSAKTPSWGMTLLSSEEAPKASDQGLFEMKDARLLPAQINQLLQVLREKGRVQFTAFFDTHKKYVTYTLYDSIDLRGIVNSLEVSLSLIFLIFLWWWIFVYYEKKLPLRIFQALTGELSIPEADPVIQSLKEKIEAHYQEKNLMLRALSHDIKTPLTEAMLSLDLIETPELSKTVKALRKNLEQIHSVIKTSLDYAKDEQDLERSEMDSVAFCRKIVEAYVEQGKQVEIQAETPKILVKVEAALIRRLLINLIENGLRYGHEVQVFLRQDKMKQQLILEVQDKGPGVSEENLSKLGFPYYREDPSRSRMTGGMGLGLAIVKKIADLHGGKVEFSNRPRTLGGGLCVRVFINLGF